MPKQCIVVNSLDILQFKNFRSANSLVFFPKLAFGGKGSTMVVKLTVCVAKSVGFILC